MPHLNFQFPGQATRQSRERHELPKQLQTLLVSYRHPGGFTAPSDSPRIRVNAVVSIFAGIYEKIRNAVEYHEDHLLRRNATERILKRRLLFRPSQEARAVAKLLLAELIRAGYLPDDTLPESKINEVAVIIGRYLQLMQLAKEQVGGDDARGLAQWLISMMSTDIEENLVPPVRSEALVTFAYEAIRKDVFWRNIKIDERERDLQLFIGVHRALIRSDQATIRNHLLHLYVPEWRQGNDAVIRSMAANLPALRRTIEHQAHHPLADVILRTVKRVSTVFLVLQDVIAQGNRPEDRLSQPNLLEESIKTQASRRYKTVTGKITRSVLRAVIYIFLTKSILALTIEFPYELFFVKSNNLLPLAINVAFHPLFLFLIAVSVRVPAQKNTEKLVSVIKGLLYHSDSRNVPLEINRPRKGVMTVVFRLFYLIMFFVSYGLIFYFLKRIGFNELSAGIFLFFLSVISFFGIRIRQQTRELIVLNERENLLTTVVDLFSVPILQVGRWLSLKAPKINVFIFILDFIIEAPFKTLIEVIEDWFSFVREKKEEVY